MAKIKLPKSVKKPQKRVKVKNKAISLVDNNKNLSSEDLSFIERYKAYRKLL